MNDFVLNIILSEIEHQGWDNIYPPKFKECAVEIYQAIEKAGYCITPTMRTAKPKPTPTPSLGLLECGEMRTDKRFTQSTLTALQAKLEKVVEWLQYKAEGKYLEGENIDYKLTCVALRESCREFLKELEVE